MINGKDEETYNKIKNGHGEYVRFTEKDGDIFYICKITRRYFSIDGDFCLGLMILKSNARYVSGLGVTLHYSSRHLWHPEIINDESELLAMVL